MSEEIKDVNAKIDAAEEAMKKYASKDTVISIGGYEFTPAKLMVAFTLVSSTLGGLYGAFEVYKDYQSMKKRIAEYVAPDLSVFDKRLAVIEENSQKATDYTRDIKNDLKADVRRVEILLVAQPAPRYLLVFQTRVGCLYPHHVVAAACACPGGGHGVEHAFNVAVVVRGRHSPKKLTLPG